MSKPTSKVIQISTIVQNCSTKTFIISQKEPIRVDKDEVAILVTLCSDGSIWQLAHNKWECILEAENNNNQE